MEPLPIPGRAVDLGALSICHTNRVNTLHLNPSTPAENASQPKPMQAPTKLLVGPKVKPKKGESKNEAYTGSRGPKAFVGLTFMYSTSDSNHLPVQKTSAVFVHMGTTIIQYSPGVRTKLSPVTWTVYSGVKAKERPVGVLVAAEVPEAITVPALPAATPWLTDQ